jgi:RNA exonuclease 1
MFSGSGLFKNIPCPNGAEKCMLVNCIFSHAAPKVKTAPPKPSDESIGAGDERLVWKPAEDVTGDHKRRKIQDGSKQVAVPQFGAPFVALSQPKKPSPSTGLTSRANVKSENGTQKEIATASRPISPPPLGSRGKKSSMNQSVRKVETELVPRALTKDPAPYMTRYKLLKLLHDAMARLNEEMAKIIDDSTKTLYMSKNELICAAMDEEEVYARGKPSVYDMQVKHRISAIRKMKVEEWKAERLETFRKAEELANPKPNEPKRSIDIEIDLSVPEQLTLLNRFILKPQDLRNAGYITSPPTETQIEDAKKAVESSANYEKCDRCGTRFQVYPDGREDGILTTNGNCQFHWGRLRREEKKKTDFATGTLRESMYTCCHQPQGTLGCSVSNSHVFKITGPNRLASILQFENTPVNNNARRDLAVAFDCEMAWTCYGLELIRLSATSWPKGDALIDVLVQPFGQILDFNTRFSGISSELYMGAIPYDPQTEGPLPPTITSPSQTPNSQSEPLRIVSSPSVARGLLLSHITTTTPLIGHALDNDMNVLRLIHPTIIDTSILFAHPAGLPVRYSLKNLVKQFLNVDIQMGGEAGHDSLEDSKATGELVRWKIVREWASLKKAGWNAKDGEFFHGTEPAKARELPAHGKTQSVAGKKRKSEG